MEQRSIRELDSLADRIRLHRQADRRGMLVVENQVINALFSALCQATGRFFLQGPEMS